MDESRKKSKVIGYILGIFAFIAIVVGATYAWLTWRSNSITLSGLSECFDVIYYRKDLGTAQNPAKLRFMTTYNRDNMNQLVANQDYAEVGLSLDPNCTNLAGLGKIYLTTNANTSSAILTGGLYYTLIKVENNTETFIKEGPITSTGDMLLQDNIFVSTTTGGIKYRVYIWINGPITTDQSYVGSSYIGEIRAEVESQEDTTPVVNAAEYITNLYTNATKSTATVNNITYNLAPSVNLMNDRHASMSTDINGGDIRFYGANPNNYAWLGDSYTGGNWEVTGDYFASSEDCLSQMQEWGETDESVASYSPYSTVNEYCTYGEQKKLWRIVGVFNGRLKLVSEAPISNQCLSWDTSANTVNNGVGINQWGPSGSYEGADLMRLLNPGYEQESVNNSLYWNKETGTVYTDEENATTTNVSFANTGLTANERNMIDTATWYTGAYSNNVVSVDIPITLNNFLYVDRQYNGEKYPRDEMCYNGDYCNDGVTRTGTWTGKVGLISASDFGYGANLSQCSQALGKYYETGCLDTNWLNNVDWTLSLRVIRANNDASVFVGHGELSSAEACSCLKVHSAVYLKSGVTIDADGKDGSRSNPYVLSY